MTEPAPPQGIDFAIFLPSLAAGGAERVLLAIAGEITRRGYRCDLVTAKSGGRWLDRIPDGVRHVDLARRKPLHAVPQLVGYLLRARPRALLSTIFSANVAAIVATRLLRVRCILREANYTDVVVSTPSMITSSCNRLALRYLYRRADAIIALTSGLRAHIIESTSISPDRVSVIPNPKVPCPDMPSPPRDPELVVACGRLEDQKDFRTLLLAFASVRKERRAHLVVLGEGSQLGMLRRLAATLEIESDVKFVGYTENVQQWMRRAKVFVSTSRVEGFPNVLLEAVSNGCAVVSTNSSDAVSEILDDAGSGIIVPVGDTAGVAKGISAAMSLRPKERLSLSKKYDLAVIVDQYLAVLEADEYGHSDDVRESRTRVNN